MVLEFVERSEEASAGLGHAHRLGHVPLMDDHGGSAAAEVVERAVVCIPVADSTQASRSGGTTSVKVATIL